MILRTLYLLILITLYICPAYAVTDIGHEPCQAHSRPIESCQDSVFGTLPINNTANEIKICRNHYLVSANIVAKTPNWVAYHLTLAYIPQSGIGRGNYFCPDPCLRPGQRAETNDYDGLYPTYNRGHMTPAKDNKWDFISYQESYYLS